MVPTQLRIFNGPEEQEPQHSVNASATARPCVTLALSEVLPALADAVESGRGWVKDFSGDEITISADLYEVLMSYRYFRPVA
jgi:hypothetical protein